MSFEYPKIKKEFNLNIKFNQTIGNSYGWLEDLNSSDTNEWIDNQNALTKSFINKCEIKDKIQKELSDSMNYVKKSPPRKIGSKYYYWKNDGLLDHSILYVQSSLTSASTIFFDPNKLSEDGSVSVNYCEFSGSGKYFAYAISKYGSDWVTINIIDVKSNTLLDDNLEQIKQCNIAWMHDDGFFYERSYETTFSIYYHKLKTHQREDFVVCHKSAKIFLTNCNKYLMFVPPEGSFEHCGLRYANVNNFSKNKKLNIKSVSVSEDQTLCYVHNIKKTFYFITNHNTNNSKIISIDIDDLIDNVWLSCYSDVVSSTNDILLNGYNLRNEWLILKYSHHVSAKLKLYSFHDESIIEIPIPKFGNVSVNTNIDYPNVFIHYRSFLDPGTIYKYNCTDNSVSIHQKTICNEFNPDDFTVDQIFYKSGDVSIPMYIVGHKTLQKDGKTPLYLTGYGGFNLSIFPYFIQRNVVLMKNLKIRFVVANIRGGNEYGRQWYNGGRYFNKQNTFIDFENAAKYLIKNKYTCSSKLIISGASNGGLLVAACMNHCPTLYKCVICEVAVLDMTLCDKYSTGSKPLLKFTKEDYE